MLNQVTQCIKIAAFESDLGNYDSAVEYYNKAANLLEKASKAEEGRLKNTRLGYSQYYRAFAHINLCYKHYHKKNLDEAAAELKKASELLENSSELATDLKIKTRRKSLARYYAGKRYEILAEKGDERAEIYQKRADELLKREIKKRVTRKEERELEKLVVEKKPEVTWEEIAGLEEVKKRIREAIIIPLKNPEIIEHYGVEPWHGILLYGPPGCGKTLLSKAAANECDATFFEVSFSELSSKWYGESEKRLKELFDIAREKAPSIIFFDELDSLAASRDESHEATGRIVNEFLRQLDGLRELKNVLVIGATNRPHAIDAALLRPKRFDKRIYVPPPDKAARKRILELNLRNKPIGELDLDKLAEQTEGYSGADIYALCNEVGWQKVEAELQTGKPSKITMEDFEEALKKITPSIKKEMIERYERWQI